MLKELIIFSEDLKTGSSKLATLACEDKTEYKAQELMWNLGH